MKNRFIYFFILISFVTINQSFAQSESKAAPEISVPIRIMESSGQRPFINASVIALRVSKLYDIDAELFIYTEGREQSLIKFAMDEIANFKKSGILKELPPQQLFHLVSLGNTALALQVELNHCLYRRYELERDNDAIRQLNEELKNKLQNE
jgi:hypothetical protein